MSRAGLIAAVRYGALLPTFRNLAEAKRHLLADRTRRLAQLRAVAKAFSTLSLDGSPESLVHLESWYLELFRRRQFSEIGVSREEFEKMMTAYFYSVVVNTFEGARWRVEAFPFARSRYTIGVSRGLVGMTGDRIFRNHFRVLQSKRRKGRAMSLLKLFEN
ncbi:hypothetical protein ASA1KI_03730 [Opitutales bacterium ASA1]|nr:hypothetical protein ASA1KI_03730 [Opitutales bacterium ASA1]